MTDHDDKLRRAYRDLAQEEPSALIDAAVLKHAREHRVPRSRPIWMVPVSIAAVLVLGIGVSLRMQMEEPGVETSVPAPSTVPEKRAQETLAPPATPAATRPAPAESARDSSATMTDRAATMPVPKQKVEAQGARARQDEAPPQSNFVASPPPKAEEALKERKEEKPAAAGALSSSSRPSTTTPSISVAPPPAAPPPAARAAQPSADRNVAAPAAGAAAPAAIQQAPAAPQSMPLRAKRDAEADTFSRELRKSVVTPEADPDRELERIATLRAEGRHAEADQALEAFRKRFPDFRIPDPMWERVRPR